MKHSLLILLALLALAAPSQPAMAVNPPAMKTTFLPAEKLATHRKTIERLETYLSNIHTIISDFTQVAPDGSLASGKFFMERPGKMRWQYKPPTPILMVSNGSEFVYYDYQLEQVSYMPLDSTLIGFLARPKISFDKTVGITEFTKSANAIRVTLAQRDKPSEGQLMLEFSDNPLMLRNLVIRDATNQITSVSLSNAKFDSPIEKNLFEFRDPRKGGMKR
jgi:outer membrane lipoprotein-sorting protein